MFVTNWISPTKIQKISEITNFFRHYFLSRTEVNCYPQNKRSQRVLEKMGFTYEGILHQAEVSYDDKIYDHLCYYLEKNNLK